MSGRTPGKALERADDDARRPKVVDVGTVRIAGCSTPSATTAPVLGNLQPSVPRIDVLWRMKGYGWVRSSMTSERWSISTAGRAALEIWEQS